MEKKVQSYKNFVKENVEVAPKVAPTITPTRRKRKTPFRKDKPSVIPKPKAEDVSKRFLELIKDNNYIQSMLSKKYSKGVKEGKEYFNPQDLVEEVFNEISDKFNDRVFPLKVKITQRENKPYHIVVALGPGWQGRLTEEEEEEWLHPYCKSIQDKYDEIGFCGAMGDGHGGNIIYVLSNEQFPEKSEDYYNLPEPLYPERLS